MILLVLVAAALAIGVPVALALYVDRKTSQLEKKVARLEYELADLRTRTQPGQTHIPDVIVPPVSMPSAPIATATRATQPVEQAPIRPPVPPPVALPPRPQPQTTVSAEPSRSRQEWEALVGGKLLNRIGALALIIGVGFFLKYAFDNNWISETMRVLIGAAAGIGLLALGAVTTKKGLAVFAQGIIGAGIAILYLSVYASFNFYHLVPQIGAFVLMSAVTAVALWHGLRYKSLAVALLGWIGGFLTPFLLNTGEPNSFGLLSYLAILDLGLLAIVIYRPEWEVLSALSLFATYIVYFTWYANFGETLPDSSTVAFLSIFWGLFYLSEMWLLTRQSKTFDTLPVASAANVVLFVVATWLALGQVPDEPARATIMVVLAAIYGSAFVFLRGRAVSLPLMRDLYAVASIILLALATYIVWDSFTLVTVWSLEALVLVGLGTRFSMRSVWGTCLIFLAFIALYLVYQPTALHYEPIQEFKLLFNSRALAFVALAAVMALSSMLFGRFVQTRSTDTIRAFLAVGWASLLFGLLSAEVSDYFRQRMELSGVAGEENPLSFVRLLVLIMLWSVYALPLAWLGIKRSSQTYLVLGVSLLGLATVTALIFGFNYRPIEQFVLFLNLRLVAFVVLIAALHVAWRLLADSKDSSLATDPVLPAIRLAIVLVLLYLFTAETWNVFDRLQYAAASGAHETIARLADLQQLTLSGVWLVFSVALMALGIWRRAQMLRIIAIVLFGITILKIFIYDLSFLESLYRICSFIGLGVILLAVSYLYQRYKGIIFGGRTQTT